ncbi:MAG: putative membrane protein [Haloquadratum sp. J07HQX50]|jgi:hypothetical protein|nr:MAG: putative membrane protein [Haloquadratum sp. J07HQX50]
MSLISRALWFLFIGWWASGIWLTVAWVFNLSLIGMPLGIKMINKIPWIVSLKDPNVDIEVLDDDSGTSVREQTPDQRSLLLRGVYFLLVGWWASGVWMSIAWILSVSIIGLPAAIWMYSKLPAVVSLYSY